MGIEIDFLAVGEVSKSGDAIAVRFGNPAEASVDHFNAATVSAA